MSVYDSLDAIGAANLEGVGPGKMEIKKAILHHGPGHEYTIGPLIKEIQYFEDIETVGVTGFVDLHDNVNLFQGGPLIGHELLYLHFETAGASDAGQEHFGVDHSEHPLFVFKVDNMTADNFGPGDTAWLDYRLHFCSPELLRNSRIRISQSYQGNIHSIIEDILDKEIKTRKPFEFEETLDIYHKICPNLRPYDFIAELVPSAQMNPKKSKKRGRVGKGKSGSDSIFKGRKTDFVFYETATRADGTGGFHFLPAISMESSIPETNFTLSNTKDTLGLQDVAAGDSNMPETGYVTQMLTSLSYQNKFLGDKFETVSTGLWAGKHIRHNSFNKSFDVFKHDYQKQLEHERFSLVSKTFDYMDDRPITEFPDAKVRYSSGQGSKKISNINTNTRRADYPYSITTPSASLLRVMNMGHVFGSHRIEFILPGVSGISVGSVCFANLPDVGYAAGQRALDGARQLWENRLDNTWIVTKVAHRLVTQGPQPYYATNVEIANTMSSTAQVLNSYGQLGGGGYTDVG